MNVLLEKVTHRKLLCIAIRFDYNYELKEYVKQFPKVRWSQTFNCFYLGYSPSSIKSLTAYLQKGGYSIRSKLPIVKTDKRIKNLGLPPLTFERKKVLHQYRDYLLGLRYSLSTQNVYSQFIREFLRFTKTTSLESLTENDVRLYIE